MKKFIIATGVAVLALASVAGAQGYAFSTNLTVGSTGADVSALQSWLIANGYSIPAIVSGAAAKGYFGSQTKAAVMKYQAAVGLPSTGFVGPLTRGVLNGGASTPVATGCPTGYICTINPGVNNPGTVTGPTGITTPGVPGIMTVTSGPLSSVVSNVGSTMVPVLTLRVQAQYSDLSVQSMNLDLGNNTGVYNKIFNKLYVTDGTNVLASVPLNSSTVVQSGSDYIVGLAGFNTIVPKGTYKDLVIKADLNSSIDSTYLSSGSKYPGTNGISASFAGTSITSGAPSTGWGIGVLANGLRAVDGAGINLNGPTSGFVQALTINSSLVDTAQANVSRAGDSPLANSIPVTDTTNGQYNGLTVLKFDVNAQNDALHLHEVKVGVTTSGTGSVSAAYLYNGATLVTSASVSSGLADFTNITDGTAGAMIARDTTGHFTVKVDVTGVTSNTLSVTAAVATSTFSTMTVYNSIDGNVSTNGSASGATQTVAAAGPLFTLAGAPTITKTDITAGNAANTTYQYTATFNVNVQAIGTDVDLGLPASTTAAFGTTTTGFNLAQLYQNGTASTSTGVTASYSQPTNTTLSSDGTYFTVARNQSVTIPVKYSFTVINPAANTFAVQGQGIQWEKGAAGSARQQTSFMANQQTWRTDSI